MAVNAESRPPTDRPSSRRPLEPKISYDRDSDELVAFFYGPLPHVADYFTDEAAFLVDPDTDELLGFQIDDFLSVVAPMRPLLYKVLLAAHLRGITPEEVQGLQERAESPYWTKRAAALRDAYLRRAQTHRERASAARSQQLPSPIPVEMRPLLVGLGVA
jgi:hypothetical protein